LDVIEDDILTNESLKTRFHVIRAANILNRSYFSEPVLVQMLSNLRSRLVANGLLIICRTNPDGENHATIFQLSQTGWLDVVGKLGASSEIEELAAGLLPSEVGENA
jgi:chemotaxis methyl-accepting protein methylase